MNIKRPIYVGIDFCNDFSQVSYYNFTDNEPVSVDYSGLESKYNIPTVVSKTIGKDEWFSGDEARKSATLGEAVLIDNLVNIALERNPVIVDDTSVMPVELISIFLDEMLQSVKIAAGVEHIEKVCITMEYFHISLLNILAEAMNKLGYPKDKVIFTSHTESFVYYSLCQKSELWQNDVALFEYGKSGLKYQLMNIAVFRGKKIVMTHSEDFTEEMPYSLIQNKASVEYMDKRLTEIASRMFDKKNISTVYLTGKAFSEDFNSPDFIKFICNRRRVFSGQNLYVKGACYQAYESGEGSHIRDFILACPERITTGIELKIQDRGRDKILRMVLPGVNWYGADCSYDLIVDDTDELEIFLSPVDTVEKQVVRVSLADFPERPKKTTKITLKLSFTSDSRCHLMVIDKGFGDFFASSGRIINEEILL